MTRLLLSFRPACLLTLATLLATPALLLSGCGSSAGDAEQASAKTPAASPAAPAAYPAVRVTAAPPAQALSLPGELESFYQTDVTPRVSAYVRKVNVDIGARVRAGQVLAELEAPELTAALNEALSKQKAAEATAQGSRGSYRRLRQTARTAGAVSPLALDQARTLAASDSLNVVAARAHYHAAAQMAAYLRLTAPFAGTITERTAAPGALVSPGGLPLFKLKQLSPLRLRVAVPEAYVGEIHDGNPVQFTVRAFPGRTFTGKLTRTAGSVQAATRSEQVELDIPNPKEELQPGMFASASLPVQARANSLFVPKSAVVNTAERTYLIRVVDGRTELVDVQLGDENAGQVQVFGKLQAGDVVLKAGSEEISAGQTVQVTLAAQKPGISNPNPSRTL